MLAGSAGRIGRKGDEARGWEAHTVIHGGDGHMQTLSFTAEEILQGSLETITEPHPVSDHRTFPILVIVSELRKSFKNHSKHLICLTVHGVLIYCSRQGKLC